MNKKIVSKNVVKLNKKNSMKNTETAAAKKIEVAVEKKILSELPLIYDCVFSRCEIACHDENLWKHIFTKQKPVLIYDDKKAVVDVNYSAGIEFACSDPGQYKSLKKTFSYIIYRADYGLGVEKAHKQLRHVMEHHFCDAVVGLECDLQYDGLHSKKIGFNQVLAKFCHVNGICVLFDLSSLLACNDKMFAVRFGRIQAIHKLCKKYDVKMQVCSFASNVSQLHNPHDMNALLRM